MKKLLITFFVILLVFGNAVKPIDNLQVSGPFIINGQNQLAILRGTSRAGTEYACVQNNGIFDGPADNNVLNAMKSWGMNTVRVPLNEQCWLGITTYGNNPSYAGTNYQNAIINWVDLIYAADMAVILELHWSSSTSLANHQEPMPNTANSVTFWTQVANTFKNRSYVIFEPFNEPFPDNNNWNSSEGWRCWRDGGSCTGINYQVAGMQTLVNTIRATGATNIIGLGGISYSNSLAQWVAYKPTDPLNNLVAVWHSYATNVCNDQPCWDKNVKSVVQAGYPILATEIGEYDCAHGYIDQLMPYLDNLHINYLGWVWNTWSGMCGSGPTLISDESGTATNYGIGYKTHINGQTTTFPSIPPYTTVTPGPTTTPGPTAPPSSSIYTIVWNVAASNDYWTQFQVTPKPPGDVYVDCGYGKRLTSIPDWSNEKDVFILGNTNTQCNTNKNVIIYAGGYVVVSKSDGTGINSITSPSTSYTLTWAVEYNNNYWSQVEINPRPNVPVYMDCGYFVYATSIPSWSTAQNVFVLGDTQKPCTSTTITVYIGTNSVVSKTDGTGTNTLTAAPTSAPTTSSPTNSPSTSPPAPNKVNACFYTSDNCSSSTPLCETATIGVENCLNNDGVITYFNLTSALSTKFSITSSTSGSFSLYPEKDCKGQPTTYTLKVGDCIKLGSNRSLRLTGTSKSVSLVASFFVFSFVMIFNLLF